MKVRHQLRVRAIQVLCIDARHVGQEVQPDARGMQPLQQGHRIGLGGQGLRHTVDQAAHVADRQSGARRDALG